MSRILLSNKSQYIFKRNTRHHLSQQREFIPVLIGGLAVLAVGAVVRYAVRAKIRVQEEEDRVAQNLQPDEDTLGNVNSLAKILQKKSLGVDIGSFGAKISLRNAEQTRLMEGGSGNYCVPTVILNTPEGEVVGAFANKNRYLKASDTLRGYHMLAGFSQTDKFAMKGLRDLQLDPSRMVPDESGRSLKEVAFAAYSQPFTASRLRTLFAKELFQTAASKDLEAALLPAVLSVPNYFSDEQKLAAVESARLGGLNIIYAIPDSLSSVLGMHARGHIAELLGTYVVVDVGGSLTQFSVLHCRAVDEEPTLIAQKNLFTGSDAINDLLANFIAEKFEADNDGINLLSDTMAKQRLYDAIESLKIDLSFSMSSSLNVPYITANAQGKPLHLLLDISRSTFENLIKNHIDQLSAPLPELLKDANISDPSSQLSGLIIVGGGSRVPIVLKSLSEAFGGPLPQTCFSKEPEEIVAVGAAQFPKHY